MRCPVQTFRFPADSIVGPSVGGDATFESTFSIAPRTDVSRLYLVGFAVQLFDGTGAPVCTADVQLGLKDFGDGDPLNELLVVDRTAVSVQGAVVGRHVVLFAPPFPIPMSYSGIGRMQPVLRLASIQATCALWRAWIFTERVI